MALFLVWFYLVVLVQTKDVEPKGTKQRRNNEPPPALNKQSSLEFETEESLPPSHSASSPLHQDSPSPSTTQSPTSSTHTQPLQSDPEAPQQQDRGLVNEDDAQPTHFSTTPELDYPEALRGKLMKIKRKLLVDWIYHTYYYYYLNPTINTDYFSVSHNAL